MSAGGGAARSCRRGRRVRGARQGSLSDLSDGITESLINSLAQITDITVKARSIVFRFKGRDVTTQVAAAELSVQVSWRAAWFAAVTL